MTAFGRPPTEPGSPRLPGFPRRRLSAGRHENSHANDSGIARLGRPLSCADQYERVYLRGLKRPPDPDRAPKDQARHALPTIRRDLRLSRRDMLLALRQRLRRAGAGVAASRAGLRRRARGRTGRAGRPRHHSPGRNPLAPRPPHFPAKATSVIFLFMDGGPSQVDTFDPKPRLDREHGQPIKVKTQPTQFNNVGNVLGCPWKFRQYGESGIPVSDLFPARRPVRRRPGDRPVDGLELLRAHQRQLLHAHRQRPAGPAEHGRLGHLRPGQRVPGPARLRGA